MAQKIKKIKVTTQPLAPAGNASRAGRRKYPYHLTRCLEINFQAMRCRRLKPTNKLNLVTFRFLPLLALGFIPRPLLSGSHAPAWEPEQRSLIL
ncbi:hypothetical protein THIOM_003900 [Candidatus Thiomargarita nelsonii]|uniref:Uncharacterized protein n=1 Tax=Candidatus Thiomargarita nelsonii TaxID=1003181 RepID=A0A176RX82_9GAMM|nr:hypothetical protein THIOM_003900 [Candidatus Thiomargarita nelsonii]